MLFKYVIYFIYVTESHLCLSMFTLLCALSHTAELRLDARAQTCAQTRHTGEQTPASVQKCHKKSKAKYLRFLNALRAMVVTKSLLWQQQPELYCSSSRYFFSYAHSGQATPYLPLIGQYDWQILPFHFGLG